MLSLNNRSRRLRFFCVACLVIGIVEAAGALLWSVVGAGMYGSPLADFFHHGYSKELSFIIGIILLGPGLALWAGLDTPKLPCRAAWMFCVGAALSSILGARYQEIGIVIAALVSLPMFLAGLLAILVCREADETTDATSVNGGASNQRLVQFRLLHLMLFIASVCIVIGLAFAHAKAARHRPLVHTPIIERLKNNKYVPAFVPLEPETALISRLDTYGGSISCDGGLDENSTTYFRLKLPEQRLSPEQLIKRLHNEFEEQLLADGARILKTTTTVGQSGPSIKGTPDLRIHYRWKRTQGILEMRLTKPNALEGNIEESTIQNFLRLQW